MRVRTEAVSFKADSKLLDYIDEKLARLTTFFDHIIDAKVILRLENAGRVKDKVAEVRLQVPGNVLFVKVTNKSFEASVEDAVDNLKRQLKRYKEKKRNH